MSKNDKTLNASLVSFNKHIVSIKSVVKKAKVNEVHKLIRKIKVFSKKKGSEVQLEKNKRKCEHLKTEIKQIKSLKFNEIAIFSIENDGLSFKDYLKSEKSLSTEKISLARIGFNKLVVDSVNKMKTDPKIDGWKRTFIQYKARAEKRKSWKEKTKQLKDIESKLNLNQEQDEQDEAKSETKQDQSELESETELEIETESKPIVETDKPPPTPIAKPEASKVIKAEKKPTRVKAAKERKVKFSDDETSSDESADLSEDELAQYSNEHESDQQLMRKVKFSDDESSIEDETENEQESAEESAEEEEEEEEEDEEDVQSDQSDAFEVEKFEPKPKEAVKMLKPLVFESKSSKMEIKQLNLDELDEMSEIPISNKEASMSDDDDNEENETNKTNDNESFKIVPISSDPFFLDKNGREIYNSNFDYNLRETDSRSSFKRYDQRFNGRSDNRFDNKETFRNKRDSLNSSFKTSLSSSRPNQATSFSNRGRDFADNRTRPYNNNSYSNGNSFNRNTTNSSFSHRDSSFRSNFNTPKPAEPAQDLSKLHPSWQAKKIMEDKLKSMKFEGKKVKFDD